MNIIKIVAIIVGIPLSMFSFLAMCIVKGKMLNIDIFTQPIPTIDFIFIIITSILILFVPLIFYNLGNLTKDTNKENNK